MVELLSTTNDVCRWLPCVPCLLFPMVRTLFSYSTPSQPDSASRTLPLPCGPSLLRIVGQPLRNVLVCTPSHFGPPRRARMWLFSKCWKYTAGRRSRCHVIPSVVVFRRPGCPAKSSNNVGVSTPSILFAGRHAVQCSPDTGGPA